MIDLTPEEEKKLRIAFVQTFGTVAGQIALKYLEGSCFKYQTTFVPGSTDETLINEGARRTLLTIEELMSDEGIQKLGNNASKK